MLFNWPVEICYATINSNNEEGGSGEKGDDLCKLVEEKFLKICYP